MKEVHSSRSTVETSESRYFRSGYVSLPGRGEQKIEEVTKEGYFTKVTFLLVSSRDMSLPVIVTGRFQMISFPSWCILQNTK